VTLGSNQRLISFRLAHAAASSSCHTTRDTVTCLRGDTAEREPPRVSSFAVKLCRCLLELHSARDAATSPPLHRLLGHPGAYPPSRRHWAPRRWIAAVVRDGPGLDLERFNSCERFWSLSIFGSRWKQNPILVTV
jgi:hypothetical protein